MVLAQLPRIAGIVKLALLSERVIEIGKPEMPARIGQLPFDAHQPRPIDVLGIRIEVIDLGRTHDRHGALGGKRFRRFPISGENRRSGPENRRAGEHSRKARGRGSASWNQYRHAEVSPAPPAASAPSSRPGPPQHWKSESGALL